MKRLALALAAALLLGGMTFALAEESEFAGMDLQALYDLRERLNARIGDLEREGGQVVYDSGSYCVGRDIPAGDYVLVENEDAMFASVVVREGDSEDSGLVNHSLINNQCVVRLKEGNWLTISEARAYPIDQAPTIEGDTAGEGGYLIGVSLPAGRYTVSPIENAPLSSYSVYDGILGTGAQLTKFELLREPVEVDFSDGEYIELSGCGIGPITNRE